MKGGTGFGMVPTYLRGHLSPNELAVYIALTWRHGSTGAIFPSHTTIAEDVLMSRSTVIRTLQSLRDKGLVTWEAVQRPNGAATSNRYTIHLRPPVSERHTPCVTDAHEVDTGEPDAPLEEDHGSALIDEPTSSGPRDRGTDVFDADALVDELEDDDEANGYLANHNWFGDTTEFVEAAVAEVRENTAIKDADAWLAAALKNMSPVGKAVRLMKIVGDEHDE